MSVANAAAAVHSVYLNQTPSFIGAPAFRLTHLSRLKELQHAGHLQCRVVAHCASSGDTKCARQSATSQQPEFVEIIRIEPLRMISTNSWVLRSRHVLRFDQRAEQFVAEQGLARLRWTVSVCHQISAIFSPVPLTLVVLISLKRQYICAGCGCSYASQCS